jgi:hypothetical protein
MKQTRRKHGAKVALAVIKGDRTVAELASAYGFTRTRSTPGRSSCWTKRRASSNSAGQGSEDTASAAQVDLLYRQIGQLKECTQQPAEGYGSPHSSRTLSPATFRISRRR